MRRAPLMAAALALAACGSDSDSGGDTAVSSTVAVPVATTTVVAAATTVAGVATTVAPTDGTTPSSAACPTYTPNEELPLRLCDSGTKVNEAQAALVDAGQDIVVDGFFGAQTDVAVKEFQAANGLEVDGIIGELTWAELFPE